MARHDGSLAFESSSTAPAAGASSVTGGPPRAAAVLVPASARHFPVRCGGRWGLHRPCSFSGPPLYPTGRRSWSRPNGCPVHP